MTINFNTMIKATLSGLALAGGANGRLAAIDGLVVKDSALGFLNQEPIYMPSRKLLDDFNSWMIFRYLSFCKQQSFFSLVV